MPASGYTMLNPLLVADASGNYRLQSGSPAIKTGSRASDYHGNYLLLAFVPTDMDGQPRDVTPD